MDVSVTENSIKTRQLLTESFSGVWSISYRFQNNFTLDYTGNLYGPMRLPLLGPNDMRAEYSPWFSIQNIQLSKTFSNSWQIYGGWKNLLNFTPAANSISIPFDPFDKLVDSNDPDALTFDPSYVYASNQGIRAFAGIRYTLF